ncbi:MAG: BACON domain-containing protein [Acidobacteriota bacterium]
MRWIAALWLASVGWAAPVIKVTPAALSFNFVQGAGSPTAAQTLSVALAGNGPAISFAVNPPSAPWLTVTPAAGKTTLVIRVTVNITSLIVGTYSEQLTIAPAEGTNREPILIPVTVTIQSPPSNAVVSPSTLDFTFRLGDTATVPAQPILLNTTGSLLPFSVSTRGTAWLTAAPPTGNIFPGIRTAVAITVNPAGLSPGGYSGAITISTPTAVNRTTLVTARLTVQPGVPQVTSVWPASLPALSPTSILTVRGTRFFPGTTAKIDNQAVATTVLSDTAIQITVPASLMTDSRVFPVTVINPGPGGGEATGSFVTTLPGPVIQGIANAANQTAAVAPGALLVLYGQNIGPDQLVAFDPQLPRVPSALGGVSVELLGEATPILYASKDQVCIAIPYGLEVNRPYMIQLNYGGKRSNVFPIFLTPAAPGIFTANGAGSGPAAAYAYDEEKKEYFLVAETAPAFRGGYVILFATGEGVPVLPPTASLPDGLIATEASSRSSPVVVTVGEVPAEVTYAGASPGLIIGILQINIRIPPNAAPGKAVPVSLRIRGLTSPPGTTLNIK